MAAKTHAAVRIVLDSVARRLQELRASHSHEERLNLLKQVRLAKVCNDLDEPVPTGVEVLLADGNDEQSASEQWLELLTEPLLIVGGTPGGCTGSSNKAPHAAGSWTGPMRILTLSWWTRRRR